MAVANNHKDICIDLLIGADFYRRFVTGNIKSGKTGHVGTQTTLRWVLNGSAKIKATTSSVNVINTSHVLHVSKVNVNVNQENNIHETEAQLSNLTVKGKVRSPTSMEVR